MRVLVDTNIMLDAVLYREPFATEAMTLLQEIESKQVYGYVTATTLTDIFYIVRKQTRSLERARQAVSETLRLMEICTVDSTILEEAFASSLTDFEDAVKLANIEESPAWEFVEGQANQKPMPTVHHSILQKRLTAAIDEG